MGLDKIVGGFGKAVGLDTNGVSVAAYMNADMLGRCGNGNLSLLVYVLGSLIAYSAFSNAVEIFCASEADNNLRVR